MNLELVVHVQSPKQCSFSSPGSPEDDLAQRGGEATEEQEGTAQLSCRRAVGKKGVYRPREWGESEGKSGWRTTVLFSLDSSAMSCHRIGMSPKF